MAEPNITAGRPKGDTQSHDHLKRDHSYSFQTGGSTVSVPGEGNINDARGVADGGAARDYNHDTASVNVTRSGGGNVTKPR